MNLIFYQMAYISVKMLLQVSDMLNTVALSSLYTDVNDTPAWFEPGDL